MPKTVSNKLKREHEIVLRALELANTTYNRVVNHSEVIAALSLSSEDVRRLECSYENNLGHAVSKILAQLIVRKFVFSAGTIGHWKYYGTETSLAHDNRFLPNLNSRRGFVLELVHRTVTSYKRPVRIGEILDLAAEDPATNQLEPKLITQSVMSLKETGELFVISSTLRKDNKGTNYYLPSTLDPKDFTSLQPLTWLEQVAQAFNELWKQEMTAAMTAGCLPKPITTGAVRARLLASPEPHKNMKESQPIVSAMISLSQSRNPLVRKIKRNGERASLWAPINVPNDDLDVTDAYASDSERVVEAVRRATERLGTPVSIRDVKSEIGLDSALQPTNSATLHSLLSDISRSRSDKDRRKKCFYRVGTIDGRTYYCFSSKDVPGGRFYVRFHQIRSIWLKSSAASHSSSIETWEASSILIGRALLMQDEARTAATRLAKLLVDKHGNSQARTEAEELLATATAIDNRVEGWLNENKSQRSKCPPEVSKTFPTLTTSRLKEILAPLYPRAQASDNINQLVSLLAPAIRRVPNPRFKYRFSTEPKHAAEHLFDRADALIYAAKKWGGRECCFQGMIAGSQLGYLRDVRFVLPVLNASEQFEKRLIGVACLAFLQTSEAADCLKRVAIQDESAAVRQAALWACGFSNVDGLAELIQQLRSNDPNTQVRIFAKSVINAKRASWWLL